MQNETWHNTHILDLGELPALILFSQPSFESQTQCFSSTNTRFSEILVQEVWVRQQILLWEPLTTTTN